MLTLRCGEAKAHHNTLRSLSKKFLAKSWLPKAYFMSYEVLFITKGGVTLNIPLYDSWTTLITLYITYDCFIPLMTLGISLYIMFTKMIRFPHIPMWDKVSLSQLDKKILRLRRLWKYHLINLLSVILSDEMMPCLIMRNGVRALFDDVLLETNSCIHFFWVY